MCQKWAESGLAAVVYIFYNDCKEVITVRYEYYQPNPVSPNEDDCVVRAICKAENKGWDTVYMELCAEGMKLGTWGNVNHVWDSYLRNNGYKRHTVPDTCPDCYTVAQFAADNPQGTYILATGTHAVTVENGIVYDAFDSSQRVPIYYYVKEQ